MKIMGDRGNVGQINDGDLPGTRDQKHDFDIRRRRERFGVTNWIRFARPSVNQKWTKRSRSLGCLDALKVHRNEISVGGTILATPGKGSRPLVERTQDSMPSNSSLEYQTRQSPQNAIVNLWKIRGSKIAETDMFGLITLRPESASRLAESAGSVFFLGLGGIDATSQTRKDRRP